jgi:ribulose-phosphate 3-epimerase
MARRQQFVDLKAEAPVVLPSLLLCDFGHLAEEIARLERGGCRALHLDVMDGHFVPNLTYGLTIVETCRQLTDLPLDAHLMIANPHQFVQRFVEAGADSVTIHVEALPDVRPVLQQIKAAGASAGLALNPPTPLEQIEPYLDLCDMVLVMSVMPGFGGQKFQPVALEKLRWLRERMGSEFLLEVDGGVHDETIAKCAQAGADLFVAGSAIFGHDNYGERLEALTRLARKGHSP